MAMVKPNIFFALAYLIQEKQTQWKYDLDASQAYCPTVLLADSQLCMVRKAHLFLSDYSAELIWDGTQA